MRPVPILGALLLAALLLPAPSASAARATPHLDPLAAAVESRLSELDGDDSQGAAAARSALRKARGRLAKTTRTLVQDAATAASVAGILGRAFPGDGEFPPLLEGALLAMAGEAAQWDDELAAIEGAFPAESREAASVAGARADLAPALAAMEGPPEPPAFSAAIRAAGRALARGRRVVGGRETWLAATVDGEAFRVRRALTTLEFDAESGTWHLDLAGYVGPVRGAHRAILLLLYGIEGPGITGLTGDSVGIFQVHTARSTGVNYNTLSGSGAGGTLTFDRFEPEEGIAEGTFSMGCAGNGELYSVSGAFRVRIAP